MTFVRLCIVFLEVDTFKKDEAFFIIPILSFVLFDLILF